jgi:DNA-directed RNA polymerase specialized sigma24 family protein
MAKQLSEETDDSLLTYMSWAEECRDDAQEAWGVFFVRHRAFVYQLCRTVCIASFGSDGLAEDITQEVFRRAFAKAGTFELSKARDPANLRKSVELWLSQIARNRVRDIFRGRSHLCEEMNEGEITAEVLERMRQDREEAERKAK